MALVIGSTAINQLFPDEFRKPKDIDVFARPGDLEGSHVDNFWHESFSGTQLDRNGYATLDEIYSIKVSHSHWSIGSTWSKHMSDILFLRSRGAKLDMNLYELLYPVWVEKHGGKKMNLAQSSGKFFKDAVVRIYDHDSIHRSCARREYALYELFLKEGQDVDMDMAKVWAQPHELIVELFREEVAATALERWLIPTNYKFSPGRAWHMALQKTITSLTKGKSSLFIIENFEDFIKVNDKIDNESYLQRHLRQKDRLILLESGDKDMQQM